MADPVAGLREMGRVARRTVAATVWDYGGQAGPLSVLWSAVRDVDPTSDGEGERAGTREGHLAELFTAAGLTQLRTTALTVLVGYRASTNGGTRSRSGSGPPATTLPD
ncbi:hypothetical protein [Mycobacterium sp. URHB0021]